MPGMSPGGYIIWLMGGIIFMAMSDLMKLMTPLKKLMKMGIRMAARMRGPRLMMMGSRDEILSSFLVPSLEVSSLLPWMRMIFWGEEGICMGGSHPLSVSQSVLLMTSLVEAWAEVLPISKMMAMAM